MCFIMLAIAQDQYSLHSKFTVQYFMKIFVFYVIRYTCQTLVEKYIRYVLSNVL